MKLARHLLTPALLTLTFCFLAMGMGQNPIAHAQAPEAAIPTFTIDDLGKSLKTDPQTFGVTIEPTREVTSDSQYFYRSPAGLQALKNLGVKTILYSVDRNNWRALYDDISGEPQPCNAAGICPAEAVQIAKAVGAELVPILNVTVQCTHIPNTPYHSQNMTCQRATVQDAVDLVKFLKTETKAQGVAFHRVVMGLEPYAGCRYWTSGNDINCTMDSPEGQHRIGLPAEVYAQLINDWTPKIHKADKSLLIGAQLAPNAFYCITSCNHDWTQTVLQSAGKNIDFVLLHQYFRIRAPGAIDIPSTTKYSYYQNQVDINLVKSGATGMPARMRKLISKWAPSNKKQMPIWYAEMNAATPADSSDEIDDNSAAQMRESLYSALAVGELYMDLMAPVKISGSPTAAGDRVFLHHLFATRTFIGADMPPNGLLQVQVKTPAWYFLSTLQAFDGQGWQKVQAKSVPTLAPGQPTIRSYAARSGKNLTIAFFNHDPVQTFAINIKLTDMKAKRVNVTRVGDQALSLFSENNEITPNTIVPVTSTLSGSQIVNSGLNNVPIPPHSLTVLQVVLK